jgi:hypothetical protein
MNDNRLNPVNTTLVNPPGAWSAPYKFGVNYPLPAEIWEAQDPSPACKIQTTAGDRQVDWCFPRKPNCPMSRELEPTQHVDGDMDYCARDGDVFGLNYKIINKGPESTEVVSSCPVTVKPAPVPVVSALAAKKRKRRKTMRIILFIIILVLIAIAIAKL